MRRIDVLKALLFVVSVVALVTTLAWGQKSSTNIGPKYDSKTEVKLKGTVEEIKQVPGPAEGTHFMLKNGTGSILVHVAPELFLKEMDMGFNTGDQVEVTGSKLNINGTDEVLAREIVRGGNSITLRDKAGAPIWLLWDPTKK